MKLLEDTAALGAHQEQSQAVCVLVRLDDHELVEQARVAFGTPPAIRIPERHGHRRPISHVEHDQVTVVALAAGAENRMLAVLMHTGDPGLLVVAESEAIDIIRTPLADSGDTDAYTGLATALLALARHAETSLADLADPIPGLDRPVRSLRGRPHAKELTRRRSQIFTLQHLYKSHARLLDADEDVAVAMPTSASRLLRRAATGFSDSSELAARIYASLGDELDEQSSLIMERLTLVSTVFLPLTVGVGFFGMNFRWMTDRIGSEWASSCSASCVPCCSRR